MPDLDRVVAGIRCRDVLALLSEYLDGNLTEVQVGQIDAHLAGCDHCERFGGEVGAVVAALRRHLAEPPPLDRSIAERLARRLKEETGIQ